jgi:hypothetical protein
MRFGLKFTIIFIAIQTANTTAIAKFDSSTACKASSGSTITPVVELYTSEGCSSCPPADKWLSSLRSKTNTANAVVVQAFHVNYWDYIGWPDRFATAAHTNRQRQIATWNRQNGIYTPQMVLNGDDWRGWRSIGPFNTSVSTNKTLATSSINLTQTGADQFEAVVSPVSGSKNVAPTWSAFWTITEHGHVTRVKAGENSGETLLHDYVVRQYTPMGEYSAAAAQKLTLRSVSATAGHERQVNLVVFDPKTGKTIQAVSANCSS